MKSNYQYDVAISFAEEDKDIALCLRLALKQVGYKSIYYYPDHRKDGPGQNLKEKLYNIYNQESRYVIALFSKHYFDSNKEYTLVELEAILEKMKHNPGYVYVIPVKLDQSIPLSGYPLLRELEYVQWNHNPEEIVAIIDNCFGKSRAEVSHLLQPGDKETPEKNATNLLSVQNNITQSTNASNANDQSNHLSITIPGFKM